MARPHEIVRKRDLKKFIPYEKTQLDEIIDRGLLEVVKLSANGRAIGITMRSIVKYQTDIMGLEPLADDHAEKAPISNQSATAPQLRSTNERQAPIAHRDKRSSKGELAVRSARKQA